MSAYPPFLILRDSTATADGGHDAVRATNGAAKVRRMFDSDKHTFEIGHVLSDQEALQLQTFYLAERDAAVDFRWPPTGQVHSCVFASAIQYLRRGRRWEVRVKLMER